MNKQITTVLSFVAGAVVGSIVSWKLLKDKYEEQYQEDIESVKETYQRNHEQQVAQERENMQKEYSDIVNQYKPCAQEEQPKETPEKKPDRPFVIPPLEFGENPDYDQTSLIYFADATLAEENGAIVEDVNDIIGFESLNHFGEYEEDMIHVQNDKLQTYYEVFSDSRTYREAYGNVYRRRV